MLICSLHGTLSYIGRLISHDRSLRLSFISNDIFLFIYKFWGFGMHLSPCQLVFEFQYRCMSESSCMYSCNFYFILFSHFTSLSSLEFLIVYFCVCYQNRVICILLVRPWPPILFRLNKFTIIFVEYNKSTFKCKHWINTGIVVIKKKMEYHLFGNMWLLLSYDRISKTQRIFSSFRSIFSVWILMQ